MKLTVLIGADVKGQTTNAQFLAQLQAGVNVEFRQEARHPRGANDPRGRVSPLSEWPAGLQRRQRDRRRVTRATEFLRLYTTLA